MIEGVFTMFLYKDKKSPYFQLIYISNNKRKKISTKCKTKSEALKFLSQFKFNIEQEPKAKNILLSEFRSEYINLVAPKLTAKYVKAIEVSLIQLELFTGNISLNEIDNKKAEQFINKIYSNSKFAAAAFYRTLKSAFSKAQEWNYILDNPFKKFKLPKLPTSLPVFINYDQLLLIISKTRFLIMRDIFFTAFHTGLRLSELLNLRWNMINFESKIITLKQSDSFTTKSKRERIIPINATLLDILVNIFLKQSNKTLDSFVFSKGKQIPIGSDWVSKCFKRAVRAAKLNDNIHFHTLRHSFASNLIQSGVSLYVVKELLGHKDFTTTQIYSHLQTKNLSDAVKNLEPEKLKNNDMPNSAVKKSVMKYEICLN